MVCFALPSLAIATSTDTELEVRITAMGRIGVATSPQYSPDGRTIAFHANLSGVPQVWWIPAEGGYPRAVSAGTDPASSVRWSPDGRLAYAVSPGGGYKARLLLTSAEGLDTIAMDDDGEANTFAGDFSRDGRYHFRSAARDPANTDAWIWDPKTGRSTQAFRIDGFGGIADLVDDKALEWELVTRGNLNAYLRDLRSGERTLLTPHKGPASVSGVFGADARTIYLQHNLDRDRTEFARITIGKNGKPSRPVTLAARKDAELDKFALSDDARFAVLVWNVAGRNELERIDLDDGERSPLPAAPAEIVGEIDLAPDGRRAVLTIAGSTAPAELWTLDLETHAWNRLTFSPHPGVDLSLLVKPELRTFTSHDGLELSGWLYLPKAFKAPGAVVLSFHGGPEGQERPGFRADYQALVASGIAVFAPNIRGSSGFGKRFMQLDNQAGRFAANKDIQATADFIVSTGIGDRARIGITGGSYGGYATLMAMTYFAGAYDAGVQNVGISNLVSFLNNTAPYRRILRVSEYGDPVKDKDALVKLSPITHVGKIKAPLLSIQGVNDPRVPVGEAVQIYKELERRRIPGGLILFADEGHGSAKRDNQALTAGHTIAFFEKHLMAK
jgi:dipeptidyl aminopeptidase/acylaminoacyl peptidase